MTNVLVQAALVLAAAPIATGAAYLLLLTLLSRRPARPPPSRRSLRFDVVVPAHDEEAGIARTVESLLSVDYPAGSRRVLVVADNCTDGTAARAREAGATVLVRDDPTHGGKGYALHHALMWCLADGFSDAVVVIDADTIVSRNLLDAFAARLERGAPAAQADNGVANPEASWRTCLMAIAFVLVDTVRMLGRERLGCSTGLRGNGMCLSARALREVPYDAFSIVEDLEYGIRLGRAGHRVHYVHDATVRSVMAVGSEAAGVQRRRWEGGRFALARHQGLALVGEGVMRRSGILLDLGLDLLVPPLAYLAALAVAGTLAAGVAATILGRTLVVEWVLLASLGAIVVYVVRGWQLSGTGAAGVAALFRAPVYLVWKIGLLVQGRAAATHRRWVRTPRERNP